MPLLKNTLITELRKFMDGEFPDQKFPQDENEAKEALANAIFEYSKDVVPPSLPSASLQAKQTMFGALAGMNEFDKGITVIKSAINAYAGVLSTGMLPAFSSVPPVESPLPKLEDIKLEDEKTSQQAANEVADIVHDWFTGWKATNTSSGAQQNWS